MTSITQEMKYRQSLITYARKHGVERASRKYNRARSYIYFWLKRYDGTIESLRSQSRRPHSHPNQHTPEELKLICDMRRRNPNIGLVELWHRLRKRGYTRCVESLFRTMRKLGMFPAAKTKKGYKPKPYEQMTHPGERVQIDVKVVPRRCIADPDLRLYQYTAIDEFTRVRILGAYPEQSTYSSADFLQKIVKKYARIGIKVECVQTDNGLSLRTVFPTASGIFRHYLRRLPLNLLSVTNSSVLILRVTTARLNAATGRIKNVFTTPTPSFPSPILLGSSLPSKETATIFRCDLSIGFPQWNSFTLLLSNMFDKPTQGLLRKTCGFLLTLEVHPALCYNTPIRSTGGIPNEIHLRARLLQGHAFRRRDLRDL